MSALTGIDLEIIAILAGSAGSILTAVFMYKNYRLSQRKPLVKQKLEDVLAPAIEKVNENIRKLERGNINWRRKDYSEPRASHGLQALADRQAKRDKEEIYRKFREEHQGLWERMKRHDVSVERVNRKGIKLSDVLKERVTQELIEDKATSLLRADDPDEIAPYVIKFLVNDKEELGKTHAYDEFWKKRREHYWKLMEENCGEELEKFRKAKSEALSFGNKLLEDLRQKRDELCEEYGIPYSGLKGEKNVSYR